MTSARPGAHGGEHRRGTSTRQRAAKRVSDQSRPVEFDLGEVRLRGTWSGRPEGPTVVLSHGDGQTRRSWSDTTQNLTARGFRVLAVDLRGHGESSRPTDGDYRLNAFSEDLVRLLRQVDPTAALVGASLGGLASLLAAADPWVAPWALVLVDIALTPDERGLAPIREFMHANPDGFGSVDEATTTITRFRGERVRDSTGLHHVLTRSEDWHWHWDPLFVDGPRNVGVDRDPVALEAAALRVWSPALVVRGAMSAAVSPQEARALTGLIRGASLAEIPRAGHRIAGESYAGFETTIGRFLADVCPFDG